MSLRGVLDGMLVIELASVLAGPSVGQFVAELGATVIKVENPRTGGDVTRRWLLDGEEAPDGISAYFACCNWGKRSLALDLSREDGRRVLHDLACQADVVLASYRPGTADALGAGAATLRALNPRLVYAHLTGYGASDPRAGYDAVLQAETGFTGLNGSADGPPEKMPVALVDLLAAHQLKEGILAALLRRTQTGEGSTVHVSLAQAGASALANQATAWLHARQVPQRRGSAHPSIAPYGQAYPTATGRVVLAVGTDRQFAALCEVLDLGGVAEDERFAMNPARVRHREALDEVLRPALARQERDALLEALHTHHVPAGAVRTVPEVFEHPAVKPLVLREGEHAGVRQATFSNGASLLPPPRYAVHTRELLRDLLGATDDEVAMLVGNEAVVSLQ